MNIEQYTDAAAMKQAATDAADAIAAAYDTIKAETLANACAMTFEQAEQESTTAVANEVARLTQLEDEWAGYGVTRLWTAADRAGYIVRDAIREAFHDRLTELKMELQKKREASAKWEYEVGARFEIYSGYNPRYKGMVQVVERTVSHTGARAYRVASITANGKVGQRLMTVRPTTHAKGDTTRWDVGRW